MPSQKVEFTHLQNGWACFDIAVGLTRAELVEYASNNPSLENRRLLAPEIRHVAALTASYLLHRDRPDDASRLRKLFDIADTNAEDKNPEIEALLAAEADAILEGGLDPDWPRDGLPRAMFKDEAAVEQFTHIMAEYLAGDPHSLQEYSVAESTYQAYLRHYYGKKEWVSLISHFNEDDPGSIIEIAAKKLGAKIFVKTSGRDRPYNFGDGEKEIHIEYRASGQYYGHFVREMALPEDPSTAGLDEFEIYREIKIQFTEFSPARKGYVMALLIEAKKHKDSGSRFAEFTRVMNDNLPINHPGLSCLTEMNKTAEESAATPERRTRPASLDTGILAATIGIRLSDGATSTHKTTLEDDVDDDSDEEIVEAKRRIYDLEAQWSLFQSNKEPDKLRALLKDDELKLVFIAHAKGIGYLYSKPVNQAYYHGKGPLTKKSLGKSKFPDSENFKKWIVFALSWAAHDVLCCGTAYDFGNSEMIKAAINGTKDTIGAVDQIMKDENSQRRFLSKINLVSARAELHAYHDCLEITEADVKSIRDKHKHELSGKQRTGVIENGSPEVARHLASKRSPKGTGHHLAILNTVMDFSDISQRMDRSADRFKDPVIEHFDRVFIYYLAIQRVPSSLNVQRGISKPEHIDLNLDGAPGINLLTAVRLMSRWHSRMMASVDNDFALQDKKYDRNETDLGIEMSFPSLWQFGVGRDKVILDKITSKMKRNMMVPTFSNYESLVKKIEKIKKHLALTDQQIAIWLLGLLQGNNKALEKFLVDRKVMAISLPELLSDLMAVLFVCEPTRNPAAFVTNYMALELIEGGHTSWNAALTGPSPLMPMVITGAVRASRFLHKIFKPYMPYHYDFKGDDSDDSDLPNVRKLMSSTVQVMQTWQKLISSKAHTAEEAVSTGAGGVGSSSGMLPVRTHSLPSIVFTTSLAATEFNMASVIGRHKWYGISDAEPVAKPLG